MEVVKVDSSNEGEQVFSRILEEINREFVKFVFSSHKHFVYLQRHFSVPSSAQERRSEAHRRAICETSSVFRDHLLSFKDELIYLYDDAEQQVGDVDSVGKCLDYMVEAVGVADSTQTLWNFMEFMVLHPSHATWLQTCEWLRGMLSFAYPVNLDDAMTQFNSTDSPEFLTVGGGLVGVGVAGADSSTSIFWDTMFSLVTLGRLEDAWSVLRLHSEVAEALRAPSTRHNPVTQLEQIFTTHPTVVFPLHETDPELISEPAFLRQLVNTWQSWTSGVHQLLADNSSLILGIPPLLHMLKFFIGKEEELPAHHGDSRAPCNSWQVIALQRLMFTPSAPGTVRLSRYDVKKVLMEAFSDEQQRNGSIVDSPDQHYVEVVKSLLNQELGDFLTFSATPPAHDESVLEEANEDERPIVLLQEVITGMTLMNTMHIAALLRMSGELSPDKGTAQGNFVVKSVVAGCVHLNSMCFPNEIFSTYLETLCTKETRDCTLRELLCPVKASPTDIVLGSLQAPRSDKEAIELCDSFLECGDSLLCEAQSVLVTRGLFWLQRKNEAKALSFFLQAQSHGRATALLDECLRRCIVAFCRHISNSGVAHTHLQASLWSLDGLAIDYKFPSDIHSTTSRLYTPFTAIQGEEVPEAELDLLDSELANCSDLLGVISNHPLFPSLSEDVDGDMADLSDDMDGLEDETFMGNILTTYARLVRTLIQYEEVYVALYESNETVGAEQGESDTALGNPNGRNELFDRGVELLQNAVGDVKSFLQPPLLSESTACASSTQFSIPQRYWLHVVDLSVWINKQHTQLHTCIGSEDVDMVNMALFDQEHVCKLLSLLLLSKQTYVPNPLNGRGMRIDGSIMSLQPENDGLLQHRPKQLDDFDAYEMDLHTELLEMKISSLCLDNQAQFSMASPLGFYLSPNTENRGVDDTYGGNSSSLYAHTLASPLSTNIAVNRYLTAPVALQSWRREQVSS